MLMNRFLMLGALVPAVTMPLVADQLAWVTRAQADRAVRLLKGQREILLHCPCIQGDPKTYVTLLEVHARPASDKTHFEVWIKGCDRKGRPIEQGVDLAYVFIPDGAQAKCVGKALYLPCDPCTKRLAWDPAPEQAHGQITRQETLVYADAQLLAGEGWLLVFHVPGRPSEERTFVQSNARLASLDLPLVTQAERRTGKPNVSLKGKRFQVASFREIRENPNTGDREEVSVIKAIRSAPDVQMSTRKKGVIAVDISNRIFEDREQKAMEFNRKLGAGRVDVWINDGKVPHGTLTPANIDARRTSHGYTRVVLQLEEPLKSIRVTATDANSFAPDAGKADGYVGRKRYEKAMESLNPFSGVKGYNAFAEVEKFRVFPVDASSRAENIGLGISAGPAEMLSPEVSSSTDSLFRERKLASGQLEVLPSWVECPEGMTFDIYLCCSQRTKLSDIKTGADKWTTAWKYEEVTSTGRKVGGRLYRMSKVNGEPLDAVHPMGDARRSYLLEGMSVGSYCYIAVVSHAGKASVVSSVKEVLVP